jgi:predicted ArsR family transcriptional regulator
MKCFEAYKKFKKTCSKDTCRYWIENKKSSNCVLIASKDGPMTLQEIGDIFGITRMRVCQIEKKILKKLETSIDIID